MLETVFYGNEPLKERLLGKGNKLSSHAVLLYGEDGLGKSHFARLVACRQLQREENYTPSPAFFQTPEASLVFRDIHPDCVVLSGKETPLKVDDVRRMGQSIHFKPNQSDGKVYLLLHCDGMTVQAQNALLKVLEEPPNHVFFLLTMVSPYSMLETVRSRVWQLPVRPVLKQQQLACLTKKMPGEDFSSFEKAVQRHPGNIGKALLFLSGEGETLLEALVEAIAKASPYAIAVLLDPLKKSRRELETLFLALGAVMEEAALKDLSKRSDLSVRLGHAKSPESLYSGLRFLNEMEQEWVVNPNLSLAITRAAHFLGNLGQ